MRRKLKYSEQYELALVIFSFIMLVFPKFVAIGFIALLYVLIIGWVKKELVVKWQSIPLLFITLYLTYVIYTLWTRHPDIAGKYLEYKLSFFLIPILLTFKPKQEPTFSIATTGYILSTFVLVIASYLHAVQLYPSKGLPSFLSSELSYIHHPTYTTVYVLLAIVLLLYGKRQQFKGYHWKWILPIILLFTITYFLFLSLAGILLFFVLIAGWIIFFIYNKWGWKWSAVTIVVIPLVLFSLIKIIPGVEGEWTGATWYANEYLKNPERFVKERPYPMSGSETRLVMWSVTYQAVKDYPLGVGTGNVDEVLNHRLTKLGQEAFAQNNYNPHNQFLQTALEIGIFGLSILLFIILIGVIQGIKQSNWLLLIMSLALAFNNLFESMLQRQSGIVFFTFVLCLLAHYSSKTTKTSQS